MGTQRLTYQSITLKDVRVASFKQNATTETEPPLEEIALTYKSIEMSYYRLDTQGRSARVWTYGWNFATNSPIP